MKKNYLDSCEFLSYYQQKIKLNSCFKYTYYTCKITRNRCIAAKMIPLKFWKLRDDLDLNEIKKCSLRKKVCEGQDLNLGLKS